MDFQNRLKMYRESKGFVTAKDFANALDIPYTRYVAYENKGSEPKYNILCLIADKLGVSIDELLGHDNRYERCKKLVEFDGLSKVIENEDGSILVKFSYPDETISFLREKLESKGYESNLKHLTKPDKLFSSREEFMEQVEITESKFRFDEDVQELWNNTFDRQYFAKQIEEEFFRASGLYLTVRQITSISSYMKEELTKDSPQENTKERLAEKQKMVDDFFKNQREWRERLHIPDKIPKGYAELLRDYNSNDKQKKP